MASGRPQVSHRARRDPATAPATLAARPQGAGRPQGIRHKRQDSSSYTQLARENPPALENPPTRYAQQDRARQNGARQDRVQQDRSPRDRAQQDSTQRHAQQDLAGAPDVTFAALGLPAELTSVLAAQGISSPFPIQAATLPDSLAGRDVLGKGRTGSGKTLAFLLPVLARLAAAPSQRRPGRPRALILAPTRELASQIDRAAAPLAAALKLTTATVYGGVGARPQISALRAGVDVLVACP